MNAQNVQNVINKLYRELPKLGSVNVDRCLWFDPKRNYKSHGNSRIRVAVFDDADNLLDGIKLPLDATYGQIEDTIRTIYNKAFSVPQSLT